MCRQTDFLVIGAGVVGLSIARALALAGKTVTIIDQSDYGTAASGSNLGQLSVSDRDPGLEYELVLETLDIYRKTEAHCSLQYTRTGGLFTLDDERETAIAEPLVREKKEAGFDIRLLRGREVREQEPYLEKIAAAVYSPLEGSINPFKVTSWLHDQALEAGALFLKKTKAEDFLTAGDQIMGVRSGEGEIRAGMTIVAAGSWSRELCAGIGLDLPVDYIRGTAMVTEPLPKTLNGPVVGGFFTHAIDSGQTIFFGGVQEAAGGIIISQANRDGDRYNTDVNYEDLCGMAKLFLSHYPSLRNASILRSWSGLTTVSRSGLPVWGPSSRRKNLFFAVGFKGAFSLAPAVGRLSADWLTGRKTRPDTDIWNPREAGV